MHRVLLLTGVLVLLGVAAAATGLGQRPPGQDEDPKLTLEAIMKQTRAATPSGQDEEPAPTLEAIMEQTRAPTPRGQVEEPAPTLVPIKEQIPAPTPPDPREVAILTLVVYSGSEGQLEGITLRQARILRSYAPNVLNRTGPWTVEVAGAEGLRYGVADPRWREVFPLDEGEPFQSEFAAEVEWELVVPLYLFDRDLNVEVINIYDETGALVFMTEVDREKWK